jgi:hypothetical protein
MEEYLFRSTLFLFDHIFATGKLYSQGWIFGKLGNAQ